MPKSPKVKSTSTTKQRFLFSAQPWKCIHYQGYSEITAYVEASGQWEVIASIPTTTGAGSEAMASFICGIVNDSQKNKALLQEAMEALQLCLEEDEQTFSSEQAAERVVTNIKQSGS